MTVTCTAPSTIDVKMTKTDPDKSALGIVMIITCTHRSTQGMFRGNLDKSVLGIVI